ncbi:trimeric LpxA-like protein [Kockiozyma suomiensis]|uniref:trimeric LpxA-like protein n=1 Tax=Kockiozyma suomiensis TaxID=1337062 RepID=UPI0033436D67
MLHADTTAFVSEHILVDDIISAPQLLLNVGRHSVINPRVRISYHNDDDKLPTADQKRLIVTVGDYSIIADFCCLQIDPQSIAPMPIGNYTYIDPAVIIEPGVEIGNYCVIGAGSTIGRGTRIGNNCRVAAGTTLESGTVVADKTAVSGRDEVLRVLDSGENMSDSSRKREMTMHTDYLLKVMSASVRRRH